MEETIGIIIASCFGLCSIIVSFGIVVWLARKGGGSGKKATKDLNEEARMIQEIYHGLNRMEDRVEALETLLLDSDRRKRSDFDTELNRS